MRTEVLVVGAGPYGFAVAGELARKGVGTVTVGSPFATWHEHTFDGMWLRSDRRASSIWSADGRWSLSRLPDTGDPVHGPTLPVSAFRRYLRAVAASAPFPLLDSTVRLLEGVRGGFRAELEPAGTLTARTVVIATGMGAHRHVPEALRRLRPRRVLHSWDAPAIQRLEDRRVLVIGGGQSAGETVEALAERNRITWAMRRRPLFYREPLHVPTPLFETLVGSWHLLLELPAPVMRSISRRVFRTTLTPRLRAVYDDPRVRTVLADARRSA